MSNKLMIFESNRKKGGVLLFGSKRSCHVRGYDAGKDRGESSHSFAK